MSTKLTGRALAEAGEARTVTNRQAFPLKLPRWFGNWRQRVYYSPKFVFKMEIPVKDKSGRTIWIETVQGSGKNHMGNGFTYKKDLKEIMQYAVQDPAHKSVVAMAASPELHKLEQKIVSTP